MEEAWRRCGLTIPSSGRAKGCALVPPLKSNVRRLMQTTTVARVLFKVDVRHKSPLLEALFVQEPLRRVHGELSFSLSIDDSARHIGYISLEWQSFESARRFFDSEESRRLAAEWPVAEILEVSVLRDLTAEYAAHRSAKQSPEQPE
jgi:hypothetical protein